VPGKAFNRTTGLTDLEADLIARVMKMENSETAWTKAYQQIYPNSSAKTASRQAKRIRLRPRVAAYLAYQQQSVMRAGACELVDHLHKLAELRDAAKADGKYGDAIKAEELRGKACGLYVERVEHTGKDGGAIRFDDPASRLEFARRVAFVLRLGENAAQTIDQTAVRIQGPTT